MSGAPDNDRSRLRPFLIELDDGGDYRLTVRETHYNSQNFPIVTATRVDETFKSAAAVRSYAREKYGAVTGEFALPRRPEKTSSRA